jgi:hypothetical protein
MGSAGTAAEAEPVGRLDWSVDAGQRHCKVTDGGRVDGDRGIDVPAQPGLQFSAQADGIDRGQLPDEQERLFETAMARAGGQPCRLPRCFGGD